MTHSNVAKKTNSIFSLTDLTEFPRVVAKVNVHLAFVGPVMVPVTRMCHGDFKCDFKRFGMPYLVTEMSCMSVAP